MSFGAGFAQGFTGGMQIGKAYREAEKEYQIKQVAAQGLAEANAAREAEVAGAVKETSAEAPTSKPASEVTAPSAAEAPAGDRGQNSPNYVSMESQRAMTTPAASGITATPAAADSSVTGDPTKAGGDVTPVIDSRASDVRPRAAAKIAADGAQPASPAAEGITLPFSVGGKGYATREEAKAAAEKSVPPVQSFLTEKYYPKLVQTYMEQGNLDAAEKVRGLIESEKGKAATAQYAKGLNMLTSGDIDGGIKEIGKFYNKYVNDGVTWTGGGVNKDGSLTIKFKGADGKEGETQMSRGQLARMAMAYNPAKLLEQNLLDVTTAEKAAATAAADNAKSKRDHAEKIDIQNRSHEQSIERDAIKDEREAAKPGETGKRIRDLKNSGMFSEDEVKSIIRASSADVGKAPHPQTIAKEVYNKLAASPYTKVKVTGADGKEKSATFGSLSEEEKQQVVGREVGVIQRVAGGATPSEKGGGTSGGSKPAAAGGLVIYDTKTGKNVPVQ